MRTTKINVKGTIIDSSSKWIYDWFDMESTCPKDVEDSLLKANNEDLEILINSGGGDVFAGSEIYSLLKGYEGNVTVKILGLAGSSASVIAMAGDKVQIAPTGQIMIHNVSCGVGGDYRDMQHTAELLENANKSICNAYVLKTGMEQEELLGLMDKETWLNAQQAKEMKFADEILFDTDNKLVASVWNSTLLPQEVINKVRNLLDKEKEEPKIDKNKEQLNKLKEKLAYKNRNIASFLFCNGRNEC